MRDREAYQRCQQVAAVAHQLGLHGLITPAATRIGATLALFTQNLPDSEHPPQTAEETGRSYRPIHVAAAEDSYMSSDPRTNEV